MIKITDKMKNGKLYGGKSEYFGVTINNEDYMVKIENYNLPYSPNRDDTAIYIEHISSSFIRKLNVPCQETYIAEYKGKPCVLIRDFTQDIPQCTLCYYDELSKKYNTDAKKRTYDYAEVLSILIQEKKLSISEKSKAIQQFISMFVCDAILGNDDRHQCNWGFLEYDNEYHTAPVFDNVSSLFPFLWLSYPIRRLRGSVDTRIFYKNLVLKSPYSLFKLDSNEFNSIYYNMLQGKKSNNKLLEQILNKFRQLGAEKIDEIIIDILNPIEKMPVALKFLYRDIILLRYLCIICGYDYDYSFDLICNV